MSPPQPRYSKFVEEKTSPSFQSQVPPMQMFDSRDLGILRHARRTLYIRQQQPVYLSHQTLELSASNNFDSNLPASEHKRSPPTPASRHLSVRSKSHLGFNVVDEHFSLDSRAETEHAKDYIPHERYAVRPCSHNTPRPTSSNSIPYHAK
jgi:hypothetical protein